MSLGCWRASANLEVSAGITIQSPTQFYQPLTGLGVWVDAGRFGRCWRPSHIASNWRPYCVGQWEWTDCGWYWQSTEPWAWACYHYGTWVDEPAYGGWIWVPATEWAPAWVTWRESDDYIGWAPCAPTGISVAPSWFVFIGTSHFCDPIRRSALIVNNTRIIERTRVISDFRRDTRTIDGVSRRVVVNQGPRLDLIQHATRRTLRPLPVREVAQRTPVPKTLTPTGTERQRAFEQPTRERPANERPPVVAPRPQPPKELRLVRPPAEPRPPVSEPRNPTQNERTPAEPTRPPVERPVVPQTSPNRSVLPPTGREEGRVIPPAPTRRQTPDRVVPAKPPVQPQPAPPPPPTRTEKNREPER